MKEIKRPRPLPQSERVVIDEIFSDGTARILRATRKKDFSEQELGIEAWENESEQMEKILHMEFLLVEELKERHLREGDVFFIADGKDFFERRLKQAGNVLKDYDKLELEQVKKKKKAIIRTFSEDVKKIKPEPLLMTLEKSREIARQEIKREFHKLTITQGIEEEKIRTQLYDAVEEAVASRVKMEKISLDE